MHMHDDPMLNEGFGPLGNLIRNDEMEQTGLMVWPKSKTILLCLFWLRFYDFSYFFILYFIVFYHNRFKTESTIRAATSRKKIK